MADDVRESLLSDTKQMSLYLQRQASNLQPWFKFNVDAVPLHEVFDVPSQASREAEFIEYWRVQQVREGEDLCKALLTQVVALLY